MASASMLPECVYHAAADLVIAMNRLARNAYRIAFADEPCASAMFLLLPRFQFLDAARPVVLEQAGQRPVGQYAAAGLAARTVVGLVGSVPDTLHFGATDRARLAKTPVHGELRPERGDAFWKRTRRFAPQPLQPIPQHALRAFVQARDLLVRELPAERDRRKARRVQDLVGVRIADAAEE